MLILHYAKHTVAFASLVALEEAGCAYQAVRLDFVAEEQKGAQYLRINPKGRVPALVTGRGILTETPAILTYIALTNPGANLAPLEPFAFARLQSFLAYLCSTVHPTHSMLKRGARWSDDPAVQEALKLKVPANMRACYRLIEDDYLDGPWVLGETYSVADPYLYILTRWMETDGLDPAEFPKIRDFRDRMAERPAVQRALAAAGMA